MTAVEPSKHLRSAGSALVAAVYLLRGARVSWPLEPASYDLLVDEGSDRAPLRVQVKTCTTRQHDNWICWVTRSTYAAVPGGKRRTAYAPGDVDVLAVVTGDHDVYLLPFDLVAGKTAVTLRACSAHKAASLVLDASPLGGQATPASGPSSPA